MNVKDLIAGLTNYKMVSYLALGPSENDLFQKVIDVLLDDIDGDWDFEPREPIEDDEDDDYPDELKEGRQNRS